MTGSGYVESSKERVTQTRSISQLCVVCGRLDLSHGCSKGPDTDDRGRRVFRQIMVTCPSGGSSKRDVDSTGVQEVGEPPKLLGKS